METGDRWPAASADSAAAPVATRPRAGLPRPMPDALESYLQNAREVVFDALREAVPADGRHTGRLYERIIDYPLREAKGLRPALAIATCQGLGGELDEVRGTALSLELFHNAFLVHDDVEDGSELRRHRTTLHRELGVPIAVNVGDGMLALALAPLLDNLDVIGVGRSLAVLELIIRMARESAEGQAMELEWIRSATWDLTPRDYLRLVHKKTAWYSFIAPVLAGARCATGVSDATLGRLGRFALCLGVAFQIQDDLLNVTGAEATIGKESCGDLWEGKRTLLLLHALAHASLGDRARALELLRQDRPSAEDLSHRALLSQLVERGDLTPAGYAALTAQRRATKRPEEVGWLRDLIVRTGGVEAARATATAFVARAEHILVALSPDLPMSPHRRFLESVVAWVTERTR